MKEQTYKKNLLPEVVGYVVDTYGVLLNAPCGCFLCSDEGWQKGHPYCSNVLAELLQAEEDGFIRRHLDSSGWYWKVEG